MKLRSLRRRAFTLVEMVVSVSLCGLLGGVIYMLASEALTNFSRNISVNKSYSDARLGLERLAVALQSAGHIPALVDDQGAVTAASPAAGIRFYRYGALPSYAIVGTLTLAQNNIKVTIGTGQSAPQVEDLLTIDSLGFQAPITAVSTTGSTSTLTYAGTLSGNCASTPNGTVLAAAKKALLFTQVACIATSSQLRYYRRAKDVATDGAAVFNNAANFDVLANLVPNSTVAQQYLPFQLESGSLVQVNLGALAPDYSKRGLGSTAYTSMEVSLGSRCPITMVRPPY